MLKIKKIVAAIFSLSSSLIFAGSMGEFCSLSNVSLPCDDPTWGFSIHGLYLQPSYNADLGYDAGLIFAGIDTPDVNNNLDLNALKSKSGWGFRVEGSYHYDSGNDVSVNWSHFSAKDTHQLLGNLYLTTNPTFVSAASKLAPKWNAVNIEAGQLVNLGDCTSIRFHMGAAAAQIKRNVSAEIVQFDPTALVPSLLGLAAIAVDSSQYQGLGPRLGADLSYNFGNGFILYGDSAAALLIGSSRFNNNFLVLNPGQFNSFGLGLHGKKLGMVPELDAKLGVSYTYELAQGDISLDLGYMATNYFNALQSVKTNIDGSTRLIDSNFALSGVYIGLKWLGMA